MTNYQPCSNLEGESCAYTKNLKEEIDNLVQLLKPIMPSQYTMPRLEGVDVHGESIPLNELGGDQIIFIDYQKRYGTLSDKVANKAGILLTDSVGHSTTSACLSSSFYYSLSTGLQYELEKYGEVTIDLFDKLNHSFHNTEGVFLTMTYGELSNQGMFRYVLAGHPPPIVFSNEYNTFQKLGPAQQATSLPIGIVPSHNSSALVKQIYVANQITLEQPGDIILLYSDGLQEHIRDDEEYFPQHLEEVFQRTKHLSARDIAHEIRQDLVRFTEPQDDISYVVIKKTS